MAFLKTLWKYWRKFGEFLGDIIGRLFLMLFYVTIVLPFGVGVALFGDPMDIKKKTGFKWVERMSPEASVESMLNQF